MSLFGDYQDTLQLRFAHKAIGDIFEDDDIDDGDITTSNFDDDKWRPMCNTLSYSARASATIDGDLGLLLTILHTPVGRGIVYSHAMDITPSAFTHYKISCTMELTFDASVKTCVGITTWPGKDNNNNEKIGVKLSFTDHGVELAHWDADSETGAVYFMQHASYWNTENNYTQLGLEDDFTYDPATDVTALVNISVELECIDTQWYQTICVSFNDEIVFLPQVKTKAHLWITEAIYPFLSVNTDGAQPKYLYIKNMELNVSGR